MKCAYQGDSPFVVTCQHPRMKNEYCLFGIDDKKKCFGYMNGEQSE